MKFSRSKLLSRSSFISSSLITLACLAAAGAAHAQSSSVQLYGLVDLSAGQFQDAGAAKNKAVENGKMSTSYLGFKGSEDLGAGLKANFAFEGFQRFDTGASGRFNGDTFWARNAFAGLSGGFGSLNLGRNTTSLFVSTILFNPFGDSYGFSPSVRHVYTSGTVTADSGWSDSVSYTTPKVLGGLTAQVQVAAGEGSGGRNVGGNLLYFGGAFSATAAYQEAKKGATVDDSTTWQLGAAYDFTAVKLFGQYTHVDNDTRDLTYKLSQAGASVPLGAGKILASWGQIKPEVGNKRTTISAGYDYSLSKRTDVYAMYMNDKIKGSDAGDTYAVGVRHRF